ncbi:MAG: hypothetical protein IJN27_05615 [Oscillospiraceae bacterium]|nr:hypothetical protein [Oscillospiraceae bacterium]
MVAGNPDKIAFIFEKVSDWSTCGCTNGIMQLYINGIQYPKELRTVAVDGEINSILSDSSPLVAMPENESLFKLSSQKIAEQMYITAFENGDYRFQLPLQELEDAGYYLFMICTDKSVRFVLAEYRGTDDIVYKDEVVVSNNEICEIRNKLIKFKESISI